MIRFRTLDPAETAAPKPARTAPVATLPPDAELAADPGPDATSKGLKRKTPLRTKKPDAGRPFRG
ncbi:hypothetical protein C8D03_3615 [Bosea sp. 124]|nr:hypothetical protein C8D03_3615 [Bosea sp. 124]